MARSTLTIRSGEQIGSVRINRTISMRRQQKAKNMNHVGILKFTVALFLAAPLCGSLHASSEVHESHQPELQAPWIGGARISQGNFGSTSHAVPKERAIMKNDNRWENIYAIDIALDIGSRILASTGGTVSYVDDDPCGPSGRYIAIQHPSLGPAVETVYMHLSNIFVKKGERVVQGEVIALSGASGYCDEKYAGYGPHLHFHLWSGSGSRDSHTKPIEKLFVKDANGDPSFYNALEGDLNDDRIDKKNLYYSLNYPVLTSLHAGELQKYGMTFTKDHKLLLNEKAINMPGGVIQILDASPTKKYYLAQACETYELGDECGIPFMINTKESRVYEIPYFNAKYGIMSWASWSPNEEYVLFVAKSHGSEALHVLHIPSEKSIYVNLPISKQDLDSGYGGTTYNLNTLKWLGSNLFMVDANVHCASDGIPCMNSQGLSPKSYRAIVDATRGSVILQ